MDWYLFVFAVIIVILTILLIIFSNKKTTNKYSQYNSLLKKISNFDEYGASLYNDLTTCQNESNALTAIIDGIKQEIAKLDGDISKNRKELIEQYKEFLASVNPRIWELLEEKLGGTPPPCFEGTCTDEEILQEILDFTENFGQVLQELIKALEQDIDDFNQQVQACQKQLQALKVQQGQLTQSQQDKNDQYNAELQLIKKLEDSLQNFQPLLIEIGGLISTY